jgi:hypothetical protein
MASDRQRAANRANAKKSSGPKSRAGKIRSSRNAYRHGLSAPARRDETWTGSVDEGARTIVESTGGAINPGQAVLIAQAELEVQRARTALIAATACLDNSDDVLHSTRTGGLLPLAQNLIMAPDEKGEAVALKRLHRYASRRGEARSCRRNGFFSC